MAENKSASTIGVISVSVPANTPAGNYSIGVSGVELATEGQNSDNAWMKSGTASAQLTIKVPKALSSISVKTAPTKTSYIAGQNFDSTGMVIEKKYNDNSTATATGWTITDGTNLTAGKTSVTISYTENGVTKTVTQAITVVPKALTSISVKTAPNKTQYVAGQNFNKAGMVIEKKYNDESTATATGWTVTDGTALTVGKTTVTISYTEDGVTKTVTQAITVVPKALSSISVKTAPNKTAYIAGQSFDPTGMTIEKMYNDGSTATADGWTVTDGTALTVGKTTVTISYTEDGVTKTTTRAITVAAKALTGISVKNAPSKTTYIEMEDFDPTGMTIEASYNDGTTSTVYGWTVPNGELLGLAHRTVTIRYTEGGVTKETTQPVTVNPKTLTGISIQKRPNRLDYRDGDDFDPTGMIVTGSYDCGITIEITGWTVIDGYNLTVGKTDVTVSYTENGVTKTATLPISVSNHVTVKSLVRIIVSSAPTKTLYEQGENFNPAGMKITARYSDGTNAIVTGWTVTDGNNLAAGTTSVTICYIEYGAKRTVSQPITVTGVSGNLTGISVKTAPSKTTYTAGQNFDPAGMVIEAAYSDGTVATVTGWTVTDGIALTAGKTTVTISYTEGDTTQTITQSITVTEPPVEKFLTAISVKTAPGKDSYIAGQNFDAAGIVIEAAYSDGTTATVTGWTVTDGTSLTAGKTSVIVSYTENGVTKTVAQPITVAAKALLSISVKTAPNKTSYKAGQKFDSTGMVIKAAYNDGSSEDISTGWSVTPERALKAKDRSVTVSYGEKTVTVEITVRSMAFPIAISATVLLAVFATVFVIIKKRKH